MVLHVVVVLIASHATLSLGEGFGVSHSTVKLRGTQRTNGSHSCNECYCLNRERAQFVLLAACHGIRQRHCQGETSGDSRRNICLSIARWYPSRILACRRASRAMIRRIQKLQIATHILFVSMALYDSIHPASIAGRKWSMPSERTMSRRSRRYSLKEWTPMGLM